MILFQSLKKNFSLTDERFYYFHVIKCMLDIPSLIITIWSARKILVMATTLTHINVRDCTWCQIKVVQ